MHVPEGGELIAFASGTNYTGECEKMRLASERARRCQIVSFPFFASFGRPGLRLRSPGLMLAAGLIPVYAR